MRSTTSKEHLFSRSGKPGLPATRAPVGFDDVRHAAFGLAYRMLGSVADAEDIVQDTWLRYRTAAPRSLRAPVAWLRSVATRLCIDRLRRARFERLSYTGPWLPEPLADDDPLADQVVQDETLSVAVLMLLERLTPPERAVYLLKESFELSHEDIAAALAISIPGSRQLLRRARQRLAGSVKTMQPAPAAEQRLMAGFLDAARAGNLDSLTALLAEDVMAWTDGGGVVRAALIPLAGRERVLQVFNHLYSLYPPRSVEWLNVNRTAAVRLTDAEGGQSLMSIVLDARGRVTRIHVLRNPHKMKRMNRAVSP